MYLIVTEGLFILSRIFFCLCTISEYNEDKSVFKFTPLGINDEKCNS